MRALLRRCLSESLRQLKNPPCPSPSSSLQFHNAFTTLTESSSLANNNSLLRGLFYSPWSTNQLRGVKVLGIDVRVGNVIEKKGRIYLVVKAQHTQQGRGGATIQVELRDVDSGSKTNQRFRTDEALERVFVEEKHMTCLYTDGDLVYLMDPETFDQIEVNKDLFGNAAAYLKEEMKVSLHLYDGRPMSASVPKRVTCTVVEAQAPMKGITATPQYKKVLLDNGLGVMAPMFVVTGDAIVIDTSNDSYLTRAKE